MLRSQQENDLLERERLILRALMCGPASKGFLRESAKRLLRSYCWREPLHQALFEAIVSIPTDDPQVIRSQLPTRLTRRGFPDFELDDFLKPSLLSREEAERLMNQMVEEPAREGW
jgi:hypothetical protein